MSVLNLIGRRFRRKRRNAGGVSGYREAEGSVSCCPPSAHDGTSMLTTRQRHCGSAKPRALSM
jgi:hypothetical protein